MTEITKMTYEDHKKLAAYVVQANLPLFKKIRLYCMEAQDEFLYTHKLANPHVYDTDSTFGEVLLSIIDEGEMFGRELYAIDTKYILPNIQTDDDYESVWNNIYMEIVKGV